DSSSDRDTVSYLDAVSGITAILNNSGATYVSNDGQGSYDLLYGIENIIGSDYADRIEGQDNVNNNLTGGLGNDRIYGGGGNDTVIGGAGDDILYGEEGNDIIVAGTGRDTIYTGSGQDRIVITADILSNIAAHRDNVKDFQTGAGGDQL